MGEQPEEVVLDVVDSFSAVFDNLFGITLPWSKAAEKKRRAPRRRHHRPAVPAALRQPARPTPSDRASLCCVP